MSHLALHWAHHSCYLLTEQLCQVSVTGPPLQVWHSPGESLCVLSGAEHCRAGLLGKSEVYSARHPGGWEFEAEGHIRGRPSSWCSLYGGPEARGFPQQEPEADGLHDRPAREPGTHACAHGRACRTELLLRGPGPQHLPAGLNLHVSFHGDIKLQQVSKQLLSPETSHLSHCPAFPRHP